MTGTERVTILVHSFARLPGGGARTYYEHANSLAKRGYDVTVLHSMLRHREYPRRLLDIGREKVRDARAGNLTRRISWMDIDPRVAMRFVDRFDDEQQLPTADLRIGTYWETTEFLGRRSADDVPVLQLIQAYETWAGPADRVDATWRLPFHAAVVSKSLRRRGLELGVPAERLHVVPNGIDHGVFYPRVPVPNRPAQLTFLAHPSPVKGLGDTLAVCESVHRLKPELPIVAFGSHPRPSAMPPFVQYRRRPVGEQLAREIYNRSSIFLCASLSEGFGFPSLEAMACGAALVSTRNGGVDDFAVDDESALIRDVGDIEALAAAVVALADDDIRRTSIAQAGMASARRYSWDLAAEAFEAAVRAAIAAGRQR